MKTSSAVNLMQLGPWPFISKLSSSISSSTNESEGDSPLVCLLRRTKALLKSYKFDHEILFIWATFDRKYCVLLAENFDQIVELYSYFCEYLLASYFYFLFLDGD